MAMFVIPLLSTFFLVNGLLDTYSQVATNILLLVFVLSMLWGVGNLLWGIAISKIGMALGFSLLIGLTTLLGSIIPFFLGGIDQLGTTGGLIVLAGIFVIMLGIIVNGKAGLLRESSQQEDGADKGKSEMKLGIILCVVGGFCAAGFNLSYHVADNIGHIGAISQDQFGNPPYLARLAVMLPSFIGSGIITVSYFGYQLSKKKTWKNFGNSESSKNFMLILVMAVIYCASLILYGLGAFHLGSLGTSVGFAIFQTGCIMVANLLGLMTGEWKEADSTTKSWLYSGLAVMTIGIIVVAYGNSILYA